MKKKHFIYFVLIAPILAKVIEWLFQLSWNLEAIKDVWFMQISFIVLLSFLVYLTNENFFKVKTGSLAYVVGIAYFLKEVYNLFVHGYLGSTSLIALIIEPIFIYTVLGLWLPKLLFKK